MDKIDVDNMEATMRSICRVCMSVATDLKLIIGSTLDSLPLGEALMKFANIHVSVYLKMYILC